MFEKFNFIHPPKIINKLFFNIINQILNKYNFNDFFNKKFVNLQNISFIYNKNKKIILNKSDTFLKLLDKYISETKLDLSIFESIDINNLIKKFEKLCSNSFISFMTNEIRNKFIENFKKILSKSKFSYFFSNLSLNYTTINLNTKISRAPPFILSL